MPLRNGGHGYGSVTKLLHWTTVVAITGQFLVGYRMEGDDSKAEAAADDVKDQKDQCEATNDSDAAEAEEERCEQELERREDELDAQADADEDEYVRQAWDGLWSGDGFGDGLSLPEAHVLLGLLILGLGVIRVIWRLATPLPPWAPALSKGERTLESGLERLLLLLLFAIPISGLLLVWGSDDWLPLHIAAHIAFFVVVGLHIGLVLKHTIIQRDRHLSRML